MSYTDEQIDTMLKKKQDIDCGYNVCEMNQLLSNKVGLDAFNLLKNYVGEYKLLFRGWVDDEAILRKKGDDDLENSINGIDVRVDAIEKQIGNGQNAVTSVSSIDDLTKTTNNYDGKTIYVKDVGMFIYQDSTQTWVRDLITDKQIINVSLKSDLSNILTWNGRLCFVANDGLYRYNSLKSSWERDTFDVSKISMASSLDELNNLQNNYDGKSVYVSDVGLYRYNSVTSKWVRDLNTDKLLITAPSTDYLKNSIPSWDGRLAYVSGDGNYKYDLSSNKWVKQDFLEASGISVSNWLSNLAITPDLFLTQAGNDDLTAFYLACDKANSLNLPVTLLARTYQLSDAVDLRKASYGISTASTRFSATTLRAIANPSKSTAFVNYQNMDRAKLGGFRVDANSLFDVGIDTSYPVVGPSLNLTYETIWVRGYIKIGWLAENNSDAYFRSCAIFEPSSLADSTVVAIRCITIGGPAQFECCNLLGGKQQVSAQHITNVMCVTCGVEFMGGSWNVYSAVGTHHFGSKDTNACFTISGEIRGFTVQGGLCEANNGGYLFNGTGANNVLTGSFEFNATQTKADQGEMYLSKGTVGTKFGTLVCRFTGGFSILQNKSNLGFFDDISYSSTNTGSIVETKNVTASSGLIRSYETGYGKFFTDSYEQLGSSKIVYASTRFIFLQSQNGYYGIAGVFSNMVAQGILKIMSDDGKKYAEYRLQSAMNVDGTGIAYSLTNIVNTSTTDKKINIYYDGGNIQVFLDPDTANDTTVRKLYLSFEGFLAKV